MLHQKVPILFKIIPHYSNGPHYDKFMTEQVLPFLIPGNTVFVDNQNYHVKGPHFEHIHQTYKAAGVNYHRQNTKLTYSILTTFSGRLPTYSPELNPIELCWSYMKNQLSKTKLEDNLAFAVATILNEISVLQMTKFYQKAGWLKDQ